MAEYAKFRWTRAKVGASMALLALVAGVTDKARGATGHVTAKPAASGLFLKLNGLGSVISSDFLKVEKKVVKLSSTVSRLDAKVNKMNRTLTRDYETAAKVNKTFLKILDANAKFLKADGTAVNAQKLGNLAPNAFFQGNGNVVSGALGNLTPAPQQLLSLPGGIIVVSIAHPAGAPATLTIHNATGQTLLGVLDVNGTPQQITLNGGDNQVVLPAVQNLGDARIQIFPGGSFTDVVSILIGLTPNPATNQTEVVAQAFTGGV